MSQVSIAEAKDNFPRLVQRAEAGEPVCITRRGRPVAVLLSQSEYARLTAPQGSLADFLRAWRAEMDSRGIDYPSDADFAGLRDQSERRAVEWE